MREWCVLHVIMRFFLEMWLKDTFDKSCAFSLVHDDGFTSREFLSRFVSRSGAQKDELPFAHGKLKF